MTVALSAVILALLLFAPVFNVLIDLGPHTDFWAANGAGVPAWRQGFNTNTAGDSQNYGVRIGGWFWGISRYPPTQHRTP